MSNALDHSKGYPPSIGVPDTDSVGERIQRAFPGARVVKTLNTVTAAVMVDPGGLADGEHDVFVCGNDPQAKAEVTRILQDWLGWKRVIDLGDISMSRGVEMYVPLWLRLFGWVGSPWFNVKVVS